MSSLFCPAVTHSSVTNELSSGADFDSIAGRGGMLQQQAVAYYDSIKF